MTDADWARILAALVKFGREVLLSPQVVGAFIILLGVIITARVTTNIARNNRLSAEKTATDRLDAEQKQKALDRSFPDRATTYLEARKWLKQFGDLTYHGITNSIWDNRDWAAPFSEASREEIRNKIEIYGTSNAARLFAETAQAFIQSCNLKSNSHGILAQRKPREDEHGLESPFGKHLDQDLYLQQQAAEVESEDYQGQGYRLLEQFTKLIQDDLADADAAKQEFVIPPVGNAYSQALTRQRRRKFEGRPLPEGETEIEDWGS